MAVVIGSGSAPVADAHAVRAVGVAATNDPRALGSGDMNEGAVDAAVDASTPVVPTLDDAIDAVGTETVVKAFELVGWARL